MIALLKRLLRWLYRDSLTGRFISKDEFDRRDPATTEREKIDAAKVVERINRERSR